MIMTQIEAGNKLETKINNNTNPKVIIVVLRRPNLSKPGEMRSDPFWEFGSFGCTGCHRKNLMNPRNIDILEGAKLAFAQGGDGGFKLILLTKSINTIFHNDCVEAKWSPAYMPFKYSQAPLLINNKGESDFLLLKQLIAPVKCPTWERKFASKFRARRTPVAASIAEEIVQVFTQTFDSSGPHSFASTYIDALPYSPPLIDSHRKQTYQSLLGLIQRNY
jgi:hypothetical protein